MKASKKVLNALGIKPSISKAVFLLFLVAIIMKCINIVSISSSTNYSKMVGADTTNELVTFTSSSK